MFQRNSFFAARSAKSRLPIWLNTLLKNEAAVNGQMQANSDQLRKNDASQTPHPFHLTQHLKKSMMIDTKNPFLIEEFNKLSNVADLKPILDAAGLLAKGTSFSLYYVSLLNFLTFHYDSDENALQTRGLFAVEKNKVVISRSSMARAGVFSFRRMKLLLLAAQAGLYVSGLGIDYVPLLLIFPALGMLHRTKQLRDRNALQGVMMHELTHFVDLFALPINKRSEFSSIDFPITRPAAKEFYNLNAIQHMKIYDHLHVIESEMIFNSVCIDLEQIEKWAKENHSELKNVMKLKLLKEYILEGGFKANPLSHRGAEDKARFIEQVAEIGDLKLLKKYFPETWRAIEETILFRCKMFVVLHHRVPYILSKLITSNNKDINQIIETFMMKPQWVNKLYDVTSDQRSQDRCDQVASAINNELRHNINLKARIINILDNDHFIQEPNQQQAPTFRR